MKIAWNQLKMFRHNTISKSLNFGKGSLTELQFNQLQKSLQCESCNIREMYQKQMSLDLINDDFDGQYYSISRFASAISLQDMDMFSYDCDSHKNLLKILLGEKKNSNKILFPERSNLDDKFQMFHNGKKFSPNVTGFCGKSCLKSQKEKNEKKSVNFSTKLQICHLRTYCIAARLVRKDRIYEFDGIRNNIRDSYLKSSKITIKNFYLWVSKIFV